MKDNEMFNGFDIIKKASKNESYFDAEQIVLNSVLNPKKERQSDEFYQKINSDALRVLKPIANCMQNKISSTSNELQDCIQGHYDLTAKHHKATKELYLALSELYELHPTYRAQLNDVSDGLASYMAPAMKHFAKNNL